MKKDIIAIPDIHGRDFWKEAIEKYPDYDTIFLGDYLDPYNSEKISHHAAYSNFLEILEYAREHENVTLLFGNHDLAYWFPYDWGRRNHHHEDEILEIFRKNMDLFHIYAVREVNGGKWLFSHGPLFEEWIEKTGLPHNVADHEPILWKKLEDFDRNEKYTGRGGEEYLRLHDEVWKTLAIASGKRGGIDKCGSPLWADVEEAAEGECRLSSEFDYFVFGHTQMDRPIIAGRFACLDTHQAYKISSKGVIEPITEKRTPDLPKETGFGLF